MAGIARFYTQILGFSSSLVKLEPNSLKLSISDSPLQTLTFVHDPSARAMDDRLINTEELPENHGLHLSLYLEDLSSAYRPFFERHRQ